jgi:hypothetical protein
MAGPNTEFNFETGVKIRPIPFNINALQVQDTGGTDTFVVQKGGNVIAYNSLSGGTIIFRYCYRIVSGC